MWLKYIHTHADVICLELLLFAGCASYRLTGKPLNTKFVRELEKSAAQNKRRNATEQQQRKKRNEKSAEEIITQTKAPDLQLPRRCALHVYIRIKWMQIQGTTQLHCIRIIWEYEYYKLQHFHRTFIFCCWICMDAPRHAHMHTNAPHAYPFHV